MAARLAPGDAEAVLTLLSAVAPTRNAAHNHAILAAVRGRPLATPQALVELADAASTDSFPAHAFEADARAFVGGDRARAGALRARLTAWRDNDARFAAVANGRPLLEAALPTSKAVSDLAAWGLEGLHAIEADAPLPADSLIRARADIARAQAYEAASARPVFAFMRAQPPADLIIAITGGVSRLVEGAATRSGAGEPSH